MLAKREISALVDNAAAALRRKPFIVALTFAVEPDIVDDLLARKDVAGVILTGDPDQWVARWANQPASIGWRHGPEGSRWSFPRSPARAVVVLGSPGSVGFHIMRAAHKRGVKLFAFADHTGTPISVVSLYSLAAQLVSTRYDRPIPRAGAAFVRTSEAIGAAARVMPEAAWDVIARRRHRYPGPPTSLRRLFDVSFEQMTFSSGLRRLFRSAASSPDAASRAETVFLIPGRLGAGGSERQAVNTALALKQAGRLRPVVVCLYIADEQDTFYRHLLDQAGIEVIDVSTYSAAVPDGSTEAALVALTRSQLAPLPYTGNPVFIPDKVLMFLRLFLERKPKIVHSFLDDMNIMSGIAAILADVPRIVLSTRSVAPDNFANIHQDYMRPGYLALLKRRPQVVIGGNSHAGAADYRSWLRKPLLDIRVVHNGIDFETFTTRSSIDVGARERFGLPREALLVGSVMRMTEEKQPLLWAKVAVDVSRQRPDVHFVLAGDGPLRKQVQELIVEAGIESRVHLLGQVDDIPALLRALDVFLLTSRVEGLPNVLIEAQAVGVPVVTTRAGGAVETLVHGVTGLVAPDQSVRGVADACLSLLGDETMRARMAAAAPTFVRAKFSMVRMLADTMSVYGETPGEDLTRSRRPALLSSAMRNPRLRRLARAVIPLGARIWLNRELNLDGRAGAPSGVRGSLANVARPLLRTNKPVAVAGYGPDAYRGLLAGALPIRTATSGRLLTCCGALYPGGAERQVVNTLRGLAARGFGKQLLLLVHRLTPNRPERYDFYLPMLRAAAIEAREIRTDLRSQVEFSHGLPEPMRAALARLPPYLTADIVDHYREFVELEPQIVHAWLDWSNIRAGIAAVLAGVPRIIISGRNLNPSNFFFDTPDHRPAYQALADHPQVVFINNSEAGAADYAAWLGLPRDRIIVVRNGVDFEHVSRPSSDDVARFRGGLGVPTGAPLVGGLFRFSPEKRPELWIETASVVAATRPDCRFVLCGAGPLRDAMEALVVERGLQERLTIRGVTDTPLVALAALDVCLLTSFAEGTSNVALEAQWIGTPVVATAGGGTRESIDIGLSGWVVDDPDPVEVARPILQLLRDPNLKATAAKHGPEFVARKFGLERMLDETLKLYGLGESSLTGLETRRSTAG